MTKYNKARKVLSEGVGGEMEREGQTETGLEVLDVANHANRER